MNTFRAFILLSLLACAPALADVKLPAIFGDHMVLQQQQAKVPIWGTADAGEKIHVAAGDHVGDAVAGADGKWRVDLDSFPAGSSVASLIVTGKNTVTFNDVLIGDVWFCSGQSNMELQLGSAHNAATEVPAAKDPQLRLFIVTRKLSLVPVSDLDGKWQLCTPDSAKVFSAVGYFFGKELRSDLKRPIGLIDSTWGGSTAQAWTSLAWLQKDPPITRYVAAYQKAVADAPGLTATYPKRDADYQKAVAVWTQQKVAADNAWRLDAKKATDAGTKAPPQPNLRRPNEPALPGGDQRSPTNLFNGMVSPVIPYAIKGVIWYQGEYNADDPLEYFTLFPRLIMNWRDAWADPKLPFLFVQLPSLFVPHDTMFPRKIDADNWDIVRDAQMKTLALPQTGMAVTLDIGGRLHPIDKLDVGKRLALVARHQVYGEDVVDSGPMFESMAISGSNIVLHFSHVEGGLMLGQAPYISPAVPGGLQPTDKLAGFILAGSDKKWVEADAKIDGDTVVLSNPSVSAPVAARYGWGSGIYDGECNLYNKNGLPACPFRTDDWDDIVPAKWKKLLPGAAVVSAVVSATQP